MTRARRLIFPALCAAAALAYAAGPVSARQAAAAAQTSGSKQSITELNVNGLKVLVKERPGSQTVAAGLYIRGGSRNVTAADAGIESLMLSVATEASVKTLVLSHLVPGGTDLTDASWRDAAAKYFKGEIIVGKDLMVV